ncbi:hypothetical protein JYK22_23085, partial [Nonomuraea sp. RK-328]|nr:hypothetical protein [Nonomuraea sp. RK-328]
VAVPYGKVLATCPVRAVRTYLAGLVEAGARPLESLASPPANDGGTPSPHSTAAPAADPHPGAAPSPVWQAPGEPAAAEPITAASPTTSAGAPPACTAVPSEIRTRFQ